MSEYYGREGMGFLSSFRIHSITAMALSCTVMDNNYNDLNTVVAINKENKHGM
jgi:hypothetical protein